MPLSVVIPALNEASALPRTLGALTAMDGIAEVVVADGGSTDATREIARSAGCVVVEAPRGRALQMNAGARAATGDLIFFLHADCVPPADAAGMIEAALADNHTSACAFSLAIDHPGAAFRVIEAVANARSRFFRVPFGDQGLALTRGAFDAVGGFPAQPLMEDVEIVRALHRAGRVRILPARMRASARRWLARGAVRTTLTDWRLQLAYLAFKTPPDRLARRYEDIR